MLFLGLFDMEFHDGPVAKDIVFPDPLTGILVKQERRRGARSVLIQAEDLDKPFIGNIPVKGDAHKIIVPL